MKIDAVITVGGLRVPAIRIGRGETLEEPVVWQNADGTPRSMDGSQVAVEILDPSYASGTITDGVSYSRFSDEAGGSSQRLLVSRAASSALRSGRRYRIRITEVRAGPDPDTVSSAEIPLEVI